MANWLAFTLIYSAAVAGCIGCYLFGFKVGYERAVKIYRPIMSSGVAMGYQQRGPRE